MRPAPLLALALLAAAAPAGAAIGAAEIRTLASSVSAGAPQATVVTQWQELLRRHAGTGLSVSDVERHLQQVLAELASESRRDVDDLQRSIESANQTRAALRSALDELRSRQAALKQLLDAPASARLAVGDGDRLVSAAQQAGLAARRLQDELDSLRDLDPKLQLELQRRVAEVTRANTYLAQLAAALHDQVKSILANLNG